MENTARKLTPGQGWSVEDSADLYAIEAWGGGYFSVNAAGHIVVRPSQELSREIDLYEVVEHLHARDLTAPHARVWLIAAARVPDDYRDAMRALGLYPVTGFARKYLFVTRFAIDITDAPGGLVSIRQHRFEIAAVLPFERADEVQPLLHLHETLGLGSDGFGIRLGFASNLL